MTTVKDLQKQFHCCMPLFIALGDKVRLSIVELLSEDALKNGGTRPVFRRSTRKFPSFSSCHFFISFPASRFFLYLQQIFNALLGLFLLKKFF
jgi:hypothetical protein